MVDPAELERFYGHLRNSDNLSDNSQGDSPRQNDSLETIAILQVENANLKEQIGDLREDKQDLKEERDKLLVVLKNQTLMLEDKRGKVPPPEKSAELSNPKSANASAKMINFYFVAYSIIITVAFLLFQFIF